MARNPKGRGDTVTVSEVRPAEAAAGGSASPAVRPGSGRVEVAGFEVAEDPDSTGDGSACVFQEPTLDVELTAEENLRFQAVPYRVPKAARNGRTRADRQASDEWSGPAAREGAAAEAKLLPRCDETGP
jgi:hypothetical protein